MDLSSNPFVVYTQPDCPWCDKVKALIHEKGFAYLPIDITIGGKASIDDFKQRFGPQPTVPQVVLAGERIGGYEATKAFFETDIAKAVLAGPVLPPIQLKRLSPKARQPERGSEQGIGLDLFACLDEERVTIPPNEVRLIGTGWAMRPPRGYYLRIAPRSGLAVTAGLDILAGVIDRDYTGEIKVVVATHGFETVEIRQGQKFAQVIAEKASVLPTVEVAELGETARADGGFGSTG